MEKSSPHKRFLTTFHIWLASGGTAGYKVINLNYLIATIDFIENFWKVFVIWYYIGIGFHW
jgi:hypothetical protein